MDRLRQLTRDGTRGPPAADDPLRVLFVIGRLEPGGSEGQLTNLLLRTHPDRIRATVVTLQPTRSRQHLDRLENCGVPVHVLTNGGGPARGLGVGLVRLARLMRALAPDVVYAWLEEASSLAIPVARGLRIPVVVSRRNVCGSAQEHHTGVRFAIRRIEAAATLATANSAAVRKEAVRRGIPGERIRVVLNGHEALTPLDEPPAPPVRLGYLAHLRSEKGHLRLLDALAHLPATPEWHADLAGAGPLEPPVRREIARLGLGERVSLVGVVADSRSFWARHHVAVLLSDHEGSSNTLIEAAMAGRPLVATDVAGNPEVVAPSGGLLVPPDNGAAISAAIARLVADSAVRGSFGAHAHRQAVERFSMQRFVDGHVDALEAAVGGRGLRRSRKA